MKKRYLLNSFIKSILIISKIFFLFFLNLDLRKNLAECDPLFVNYLLMLYYYHNRKKNINKSIIIFIGKLINTWFDIIREKLSLTKYA